MSNYIFFTDGAYSSSLRQMGIGIICIKDDNVILEWSNMYKGGSNNQAELGAVIIALRTIKKSINSLTIYTDSMYVIGCGTQGWKRKKNIVMWNEFDKQYNRVKELCSNIQFIHVKGHQSGDNLSDIAIWNNKVDKLAVLSSQRI